MMLLGKKLNIAYLTEEIFDKTKNIDNFPIRVYVLKRL